MGKKKLEIKARETKEGKQVTFSKRRMGLEKKAQELSTLCDIPLLLLLFSPGQRLSWISSSRGTPEELLMSYADIPYPERNRRKTEVLEQLSRAFKKSNHEVNVEEFSRQTSATQSIKATTHTSQQDLLTYFQRIRMNILQKLRECETPKTIELASQMEEILQIRLQQIQMHKPLLESNQCVAPYSQTFVGTKPFSVSSHGMVPYEETLGQQICSKDAPSSRFIDATYEDSWEARCMPPFYEHDSVPSFPHQGGCSLASSCLPGFDIPSNNCIVSHHMCYLDGDVRPESTIFERDAGYGNPVLSEGEDKSFLGSSLLANCDFCAGNSMMNAWHDPRPYYLQPFCGYEDVKSFSMPTMNTQQL